MNDLSLTQWAEILKDFYNDNEIDWKKATIEQIKEDVENSPMAEDMFLSEETITEIAEGIKTIWETEEEEDIEENFSDAEIFLKAYKGYLIGKKVAFSGYPNKIIKDIKIAENWQGENVTNNDISIEFGSHEGYQILESKEFQKFIDGEDIDGSEDDNGIIKFHLILQEEKEKEESGSLNHPEFKYYILDVPKRKILSGFEYIEDGKKEFDKLAMYGNTSLSLLPKRDIINLEINLDDINNWLINEHDWVIIEKCINAGADASEYSPREAAKYIEGFRKDGSYISVIKARLIYCLANAQQKLRGAYIVSNLESINEKCDENYRIQKELKRIIAMEK